MDFNDLSVGMVISLEEVVSTNRRLARITNIISASLGNRFRANLQYLNPPSDPYDVTEKIIPGDEITFGARLATDLELALYGLER